MIPASEKFLADIRNDHADIGRAAWSRGAEIDPEAIPEPGQLIALTATGQPVWARTVALRHLALIGGDEEEALQLHRDFLNRPEERLQCGAIVGFSKASTPEAASLIRARLVQAKAL